MDWFLLCFQDGQREDSGRSSKFRYPGDKKVTFATKLPRLHPETPVEEWLQREFQVRRNSDGQKAIPDAKLDRKFWSIFSAVLPAQHPRRPRGWLSFNRTDFLRFVYLSSSRLSAPQGSPRVPAQLPSFQSTFLGTKWDSSRV